MKYFKENVGVIRLSGDDVVDFLQRVSTNDFRKMMNRSVIRSVLTNDKGRIVDLIHFIKYDDDMLVLTSQGRVSDVKNFFEKYIVVDDVLFTLEYKDKITIIPGEDTAYDSIKGCNHTEGNYTFPDLFRFKKIIVLVNNADSDFLNDMTGKSELMTKEEFKNFAIENFYVYDTNELNEEINPLECGLKEFISFNKGCYIGQEVVARLQNQGKIPKLMHKVEADFKLNTGDKIYFDSKGKDTECGFISSGGKRDNKFTAIGFIGGTHLNEDIKYYINKDVNNVILINKFKY